MTWFFYVNDLDIMYKRADNWYIYPYYSDQNAMIHNDLFEA